MDSLGFMNFFSMGKDLKNVYWPSCLHCENKGMPFVNTINDNHYQYDEIPSIYFDEIQKD